jgi:hypothetical protein
LGLKHVGVYCNIIDILINYMCISWYYNIFIKYARYNYKNSLKLYFVHIEVFSELRLYCEV